MPSVWNPEAWSEPATRADAAALATYALTFVEGDTAPGRVQAVAHAIAGRGYSYADMCLIAAEVPFVPDYGRRLNLPALDQIVKDRRELQAALTRKLTDDELAKLLEKFPTEVHRDQFGRCGYDARNRSLWVALSKDGSVRKEPAPEAPEGMPAPRIPAVDWLQIGPSGDGAAAPAQPTAQPQPR